MRILHLLQRDKFVNGYIGTMVFLMKEYDHVFLIRDRGIDIKPEDEQHVIYYGSYRELLLKGQYRKLFDEADKIIVSGVFGIKKVLPYFKPSILRKTYLHFWGGDFYCYRAKPPKGFRNRIRRNMILRSFSRVRGLVFLIEGEYEKFREITRQENRHFVAPMTRNPAIKIDYAAIRREYLKKAGEPARILVGNSATESNRHAEVFKQLKKCDREDMRVYCPLSYGDATYAAMIEQLGREYFGERFVALKEYMSREDYIRMLNTMDVCIYYCDRQQAMGNVRICMHLGKKVYLDDTTSFWDVLRKEGYILFPFEEKSCDSFERLIEFSPEDRNNNILISGARDVQSETYACWKRIFND